MPPALPREISPWIGRRPAGAAARPFIKWAGGKGQLLPQLQPLYPDWKKVGRYLEPFLGGGAVYFHVRTLFSPESTLLTDSNPHLIQTFKAVRDDIEALVAALGVHRARHCEAYFYEVRGTHPDGLPSDTDRAARFIYLNKTCFNGLYRVNSRGLFNVPFGRYANPAILDEEGLRNCSDALKGADLRVGDFRDLLAPGAVKKGDFIYFDPPYDPLTKTAAFTSYTSAVFAEQDQRDLANVFKALDARGCLVMLSNSDTPLIRELYRDFDPDSVVARRSINSRADARGPIGEVVVRNYG